MTTEDLAQHYAISRAALQVFDAEVGNDDEADGILEKLFSVEQQIIDHLPASIRDLSLKVRVTKDVAFDELHGGPCHENLLGSWLQAIERDLLDLSKSQRTL